MMTPHDVAPTLARHILTDGLDLVLDLKKSSGSYLVDKLSGAPFLDFFSMYASMAVGYNHPKLLAAQDQLAPLAVQKPSCSDVYTEAYAEFMATFASHAMPDYLPHAFFIEGGALAVENGLKTAFDWKVRKNLAKGNHRRQASQVIHFQQAFHGRSGYTLSLTNTHDQRKTKFFPTFNWPRIINPKLRFPLDQAQLEEVSRREKLAMDQLTEVIKEAGDDLAALIIEPIQGEGGDNHFRPEFLQQLRDLCDNHELLYIMDEIQTGLGLTGRFWAHEHFNVRPDILCFGKKTQVCGILASKRIDQVADNVFAESSRINSTFGGNLIDMARCSHILKIIAEDELVANSRIQGKRLLLGLKALAGEFPELVSNPRGRGLMCAFDLDKEESKNNFIQAAFKEKFLLLGCGEKTIRFRPHLTVAEAEIDEALTILARLLKRMRR
ncbi:L-lysine 6-transaminase [Desulfogranum mediterraneum]|uniref:L-lysine 6-transaminase n=1 Tax=Desulfogranum mediterraneum TaxID=160661 RepID=UPI0003F7210F|nr:L-lysine 6-transaminase [Desulfogranum mediterraneum]